VKGTQVACFITPHGFGHASRMTGILEALQQKIPNLHPHLFTTVPESLFAETLHIFSYHSLACDIGLIQKNGLQADIPATITQLQAFLPFDQLLIDTLAEKIQECSLVLCDIAPLGLAVARKAGIPSVLIENFTWDWIYQAYTPSYPALQPAIDYLRSQYQQADIHIRTEPMCGTSKGQLHCSPVFRRTRKQPAEIHQAFQCQGNKIVLISMGGMELELPFLHQLSTFPDTTFLVAGQENDFQPANNVFFLSRTCGFYHPDLINAADLVICKSGYSTVAECFQAGVPLVTISRATFPESAILEQFCTSQLGGQILNQEEFLSGNWLDCLSTLLSSRRQPFATINGADTIAEYLCSPTCSPAQFYTEIKHTS
jgi:UDP:flavonoid glycosyltransferase YjiC (YdhE family)